MTGHREKRLGFIFVFGGCLVLLLLASACSQPAPPPPDTRAADESALRELDAQWSKAAEAKDLEGTVSYYSDDASLLAPNAPIVTGKEGIRAAWATLLGPDISVSWKPNKVEVSHSSDLAYIVGTYEMTMKGADGAPATDKGKLVEVWKKQADGNWKTVADIFNSDLPLPAPPAKTK